MVYLTITLKPHSHFNNEAHLQFNNNKILQYIQIVCVLKDHQNFKENLLIK